MTKSGGKLHRGGVKKKPLKITQVSLGFERAHPLVWDHFRKKNILVIYSTASKNRLKFLTKGQRIIVGIPKSQGGSGIIGLGKVTGEAKAFMRGGRFLSDAVGAQYRTQMQKIYSNPANKPVRRARCFNSTFKAHREACRGKLNDAKMTPWEFSQCWASEAAWSKTKHDPNGVLSHIPVKWKRTADFGSGVSEIDWSARGLSKFRLATLSSIVPRNLSKAHWAAIKASLRKAGGRASAKSLNSVAQVDEPKKSRANQACTNTTKRTNRTQQNPEQTRTCKPGQFGALLRSLHLSHYASKFKEEEVNDIETLKLLKDKDLKAVGLPLGPRRKLQAALQK